MFFKAIELEKKYRNEIGDSACSQDDEMYAKAADLAKHYALLQSKSYEVL